MQAFFAQTLSYEVMNTEASEACSSSDVFLGSCDLLDESPPRSCGNFGQPATPRKFPTVPCFCQLWILALPVVHWSHTVLETAL